LVPLSPEQLEIFAQAREVLIETKRGDRVYRTVIWVVVDEGEVFVRSVRGEVGRWYQRALADPSVALAVGDDRLDFAAVPASDPTSIERTSEALRRKYRGRSLEMMLMPETLGTTLRLDPV
jgi:hypothetical protein